jgi:hypothetical protein
MEKIPPKMLRKLSFNFQTQKTAKVVNWGADKGHGNFLICIGNKKIKNPRT